MHVYAKYKREYIPREEKSRKTEWIHREALVEIMCLGQQEINKKVLVMAVVSVALTWTQCTTIVLIILLIRSQKILHILFNNFREQENVDFNGHGPSMSIVECP